MALQVLAGPTAATDITSAVMAGSLRVENSGGSQLATCQFDVVDKADAFGSVLVAEGRIKVLDGATTIFDGLIKTRTRLRLAGEPKKRYQIGCQDYTSLLTDDVIDDLTPRTATESDKTRIEYWLTTYGTKGVTGGTAVQTISGSVPDQAPGGMTLYEAIADTCRLTGARFYVGFDKALHYFVTETAPCAWDFSDTPNGSTTFAHRSLTLPDDTVELVNAVFVVGEGIADWVLDGTSIGLYGRHEGTLRDSNVTDATSLTAAGTAYLAIRAYPRQAATITFRKAGLVAGMTVHVTDSRWGLSFVQFKVSKVTTTMQPGGIAQYEAQLADAVIDLPLLLGRGDATDRKQLTYISQAGQIAQQLMGRVPVVAPLPPLPDAAYPPGQLVLLASDGLLYRNVADEWTPAIDAAYITGQIGPTQIADDSISTAKLQAGAVTANEILANTITAGEIEAGAIGAAALAAEIVLASKLIASGASGAKVEIDQAGVRNYDATERLQINMPTDGTAVTVIGEIEASSLTATGQAELRGATTLPGGAVATLQVGVVDPPAAPTVVAETPSAAFASSPPQPGYAGICYDPAGDAGGGTATYWIAANPATGNLLDMAYEYRASDGVLLRTIQKTGTTQEQTHTVGATSHVADTAQATSGSSDSQVSVPLVIPAGYVNPRIIKVSVYMTGYGGTCVTKLAVWSTGGTKLATSGAFTAPNETFDNGASNHYEYAVGPLAVTPGGTYRCGFLRTSSGDGFQWDRDDGSFTTYISDGLDGNQSNVGTDTGHRANVYITVQHTVDSSVEGVTGRIVGVARQGSYVWVLDANGKLFRYAQATLAFVDSFDLSSHIPAGITSLAGLFFDGARFLITTATGSGAGAQVRFVLVSTAGAYQSTLDGTGLAINGGTTRVAGGWYDSGAGAYWVALTGGTVGVVPFNATTGAYISDRVFGLTGEIAGGITMAGSTFVGWTPANPQTIWLFTGWDWTTESSVYWISFAWYDSVGTTHETAVSPRYSITLGRRRQLRIGTPTIPGGASEPPDKVRVYSVRGASDPGGTNYKRQVEDALTSRVLTGYASGGGANSGSNTFPAATAAEIKSGTQATYDGWKLRGDGTALGLIRAAAAAGLRVQYGTVTCVQNGSALTNEGTATFPVAFSSAPVVIVSGSWVWAIPAVSTAPTTTQFKAQCVRADGGAIGADQTVYWIALGPA